MVFDMIGVLVERAAEDLFAVIVIKIVERVARKTPLFKQTDHGGGIRVRLFFHLLRHGGEEMLRLFVMAHVLEIRDRMIIVFAERGEQDAPHLPRDGVFDLEHAAKPLRRDDWRALFFHRHVFCRSRHRLPCEFLP